MKLQLACCLLGLRLLATSSTADAQGITYDCDTAAGHFSELKLPAGPAPFLVSGNVQLKVTAKDKTYVPSTKLMITDATRPGQSADMYAGFSLDILPIDPKKAPSGRSVVQMLSFMANGKEDEILPGSMAVEPGTVQPFRVSYDGSTVVVNLGSDSKSFAAKVANPIVQLICSTGEFLYTDLQITAVR